MLTFEERLALYPADHDERVKELEDNFEFYFNRWIDSRYKEPNRLYETLSEYVEFLSFIEYLHNKYGEQFYSTDISVPNWTEEDRIKIANGEEIPDKPCTPYYVSKIIYSEDSLNKLRLELTELEKNLAQLQKDYEKKQIELKDLNNRVLQQLKLSDGILQSDFTKLFDPIILNEVREVLYYMAKEGKLERIKEGRSYRLYLK